MCDVKLKSRARAERLKSFARHACDIRAEPVGLIQFEKAVHISRPGVVIAAKTAQAGSMGSGGREDEDKKEEEEE